MLILSNSLSSDAGNISYVKLTHPKGDEVICLLQNSTFFELQICEQSKYTSWFLNQRVINNQNYYVANKLDILFYCLPTLRKNAIKYSPLDQILKGSDNKSNFSIKIEHVKQCDLTAICDINDKFDDLLLYRYNENKTLSWLHRKINNIAKVFAKSNTSSTSTNSLYASNFITEKSTAAVIPSSSTLQLNQEIEPSDKNINDAIQIICDYLQDDMITILLNYLNKDNTTIFPSKNNSSSNNNNNSATKRKADWELELEIEKENTQYDAKLHTKEVVVMTSSSEKVKNMTSNIQSTSSLKTSTTTNKKSSGSNSASSKTNMKPVNGVQNISSFFTSKNK